DLLMRAGVGAALMDDAPLSLLGGGGLLLRGGGLLPLTAHDDALLFFLAAATDLRDLLLARALRPEEDLADVVLHLVHHHLEEGEALLLVLLLRVLLPVRLEV